MPRTMKVKCENCGNEWQIRLEKGWTFHQTPNIGVTLYPPKDGDQNEGSRLLRCRSCNKSRQIIVI